MANQSLQSELTRLLKEQSKARENEVFGGLSHAKQDEYDARTKRIDDARTELQTSRAGEQVPSSDMLAAGQRREWEKKSETDTPQSKAYQPYRSREKDSTNAFTHSLKTRPGKRKNDPDEGREKK